MAAHARLKNKFTEEEKGQNLISWLISGETDAKTILTVVVGDEYESIYS